MNAINLLAVTDEIISIPTALTIALIGIVVVFITLLVLIGLLTLFKYFFQFDVLGKFFGLFRRNKGAKSEATVANNNKVSESVDDEEEIAAVMAAVACVMASAATQSSAPFKVKNIRRIRG